MNIYPAIDLRDGKCVRLYQGNYACETIYQDDPVKMVNKFVEDGAFWLHIVDLDGARNPDKKQTALISEIIQNCGVSVQTGGGMRDKSDIEMLLKKGATRIIVGSLAVKNPVEVMAWLQYFGPEKIVLALDVMWNENMQPMVATDAWQNSSKFSLYDLIDYYKAIGLKHLLCTNIALDGTLNGPDYVLYRELIKRFPFLEIQASGGIQSLSDITQLRDDRLNGAIIGRALYENKFTLSEVLSC